MQLLYDKVQFAVKYKKKVIYAIYSEPGFYLPYLSYLANTKQVTATLDLAWDVSRI